MYLPKIDANWLGQNLMAGVIIFLVFCLSLYTFYIGFYKRYWPEDLVSFVKRKTNTKNKVVKVLFSLLWPFVGLIIVVYYVVTLPFFWIPWRNFKEQRLLANRTTGTTARQRVRARASREARITPPNTRAVARPEDLQPPKLPLMPKEVIHGKTGMTIISQLGSSQIENTIARVAIDQSHGKVTDPLVKKESMYIFQIWQGGVLMGRVDALTAIYTPIQSQPAQPQKRKR